MKVLISCYMQNLGKHNILNVATTGFKKNTQETHHYLKTKSRLQIN